jgi:Skp family chaperone for outer membrane proteins
MRFVRNPETLAMVFSLALILVWSAGCGSAPSTSTAPVKAVAPTYAIIDMQKVLDQHPERENLRTKEQALMAARAKAEDKSGLIEAARREFEAAMTERQNQDKAAIEAKQAQVYDQLNAERKLFIENLETEYRPLIFNIELKLKTVQYNPLEQEKLQQEKQRLEAERQQKLKNKDDELAARLQQEMQAYVAEKTRQSEEFAEKWMDERMAKIQKPVASPELDKQRQEVFDLSSRMIQDVKKTVAKVAEQEKIEIVWLKPALRSTAKDITELVAKEIKNVK